MDDFYFGCCQEREREKALSSVPPLTETFKTMSVSSRRSFDYEFPRQCRSSLRHEREEVEKQQQKRHDLV